MLNSIEAAIQTLDDAQALTYTITQPGSLKLAAEAATTNDLIDKLQVDWEKLMPGIYRVDHAPKLADKRGGLCFRVSKVAPAAYSAQAVSGIGAPGDVVMNLQQQIWNLEKDAQIKALEAQHRDEIRKLTEAAGGGTELNPETIISGLGRIENIIAMVNGKTPAVSGPAVSGPRALPAAPVDAAVEEHQNQLTTDLYTLQGILGDDLMSETFAKLAAKGQANPEALKSALRYIDLL